MAVGVVDGARTARPTHEQTDLQLSLTRAGAVCAVLSALLTIAWVFVMTLAPPIPVGTDAAAELKFISDHDGRQVAGTILVLPVSLLQVPVWVALASLFWQRRPTAALISVAFGLLYAPLALWTYWTQVPVIRGLTDLARVAPQDAATAYHILKFPGSLWSLTYATDVLGYALWGLAALGTFTGLFALRDRLARITGSLFGLGALKRREAAAGSRERYRQAEAGQKEGDSMSSQNALVDNSPQTARGKDNLKAPRFLVPIFKLPVFLYRLRLGGLLGKRFMQLTHVGHRSGKVRRTVLAALRFDEGTREVYAVSAWRGSEWYYNIQHSPALQVEIGSVRYVPQL